MASSKFRFNPYHKWLGIPPEDQPANHYRLLGIQRFEQDPDVIAAAADRQMAHVKTYAIGREGELAQNLLDELAKAKICLLNPHKKRAYDLQLKEAIATVQQRGMGPPDTVPHPVYADVVPSPHHATNTQLYGTNLSANIRRPRQRTGRRRNQSIYILIALLLLILVPLVVWQRMAFIREMQTKRLSHQPGRIPSQEPLGRQPNENTQKKNDSEPRPNAPESDTPENHGAPSIRIPSIPDEDVSPGPQSKNLPKNKQKDPAPAKDAPEKHVPTEQPIRIKLSKNHMIEPLQDYFPADAEDPHIKILGIWQAAFRYDIVPPNGIVTKHSEVELIFPDQPNARLLISLRMPDKKPLLRITPELKFGTNKPIPFTIDQILRLGVRANNKYNRIDAELVSLKKRKHYFETFISARPRGTTMSELKEAQDQVIKLGKQIPELEKVVHSAQKEVQLLLSLQKFANQLDKKVVLRYIVTSANGDP